MRKVRVLPLGLGQQRAQVGAVVRILLVVGDLQALVLGVLLGGVGHLDREGVVGGEDRDGGGLGVLRQRHVDHAGEIVLGRAEHAEGVLVALVEDALGRAVALDHRDAVLLGDRADLEGGAGAVGAEQEVDLVLLDQLLREGRALLRVALVVVVLRLDLVVLAPDHDPAVGVVDLLPELVAVAGQAALLHQAAGERDRRAEEDAAVERAAEARARRARRRDRGAGGRAGRRRRRGRDHPRRAGGATAGGGRRRRGGASARGQEERGHEADRAPATHQGLRKHGSFSYLA